MRGFSVGVHSAARPASLSVGCKPLVGHTSRHAPQRMQLERKAPSSCTPGGRISRAGLSLFHHPVPSRITLPTPAVAAVRNCRRPGSYSRHGPACTRAPTRIDSSAGQATRQSRHTVHSEVTTS